MSISASNLKINYELLLLVTKILIMLVIIRNYILFRITSN